MLLGKFGGLGGLGGLEGIQRNFKQQWVLQSEYQDNTHTNQQAPNP